MKLLQVFRQAYEILGLEDGAGPNDIKRAYRKAVALHPPDRDPEQFTVIRNAYEKLQDPLEAANQTWRHPVPHVDPPQLPDVGPPPPRHAAAIELFRIVAARLPAHAYLAAHENVADKPTKKPTETSS